VRLIDYLKARKDIPARAREGFDRAKVIVADNVADYYWRGTDQEVWDLTEDFPNIAPPFELYWIEAKNPPYSLSKINGMKKTPCEMSGVFVQAIEDQQEISRLMVSLHGCSQYGFQREPRWLLSMTPFFRMEGISCSAPVVTFFLYVDKEGALCVFRNPDDGTPAYYEVVPMTRQIDDRSKLMQITRELTPIIHVTLLATSFMHCRNVELVDIAAPSILARAQLKRHRVSFTRYSIIEIDPMVSTIRAVGAEHGVGAKQALHICRGHFKTYRQRGLFGRYPGTYWWGPQARGAAYLGKVDSSYQVKKLPEAKGE